MAPVSPTRDVLADLASQIRKQAADRVQVFQAHTYDVAKEKVEDARYLGDLRPNQNRLNVFSMMAKGDEQDYYRFQMKSPGTVYLAILADQLDNQRQVAFYESPQALRVQVMQMRGLSQKVVADSDPGTGAAHEAYQKLATEGLPLRPDKYVVRVSRHGDIPADTEFLYSMQLVGDRYYQDYDTLEHEAPKKIGMDRIKVLSRDPVVGMLAADPLFSASSVMPVVALAAQSLGAGAGSGQDPAVTLLGQFVDVLY